MSKNLGPLVSRVLDSTDRGFNNIIFQQKRPPLDSEWNLVQDICLDKVYETLRATTPSGFLNISDITTAPTDRNQITSSWRNAIVFDNSLAIVNGWIIKIGGGTNQVQVGSLQNIWEALTNSDENKVAVFISEPPALTYRDDLIFLEVWQKLIETYDPIYKYGFTQSALPQFSNDLIDPNIEIETSKRIQIQYRIRWVDSVDFSSFRNGLGYPGCYARGNNSDVLSNYSFRKHPKDVGLYIAGDGGDQSKTDLKTVDGFVYAIPLARVHRRNKQSYSETNLNGSSDSILNIPTTYNRPDKLFYDEISNIDVEDLRHKVSLNSFDYNYLLEENINLLWEKELPSDLKDSTQDNNLFGNKLLYFENLPVDGNKRVFLDSKGIQKISISITNPTIDGGKVWFAPIGHETTEYPLFDEKKFYSSKKTPTILIYDETAKTRSVLSGGTWEGLGEFRTWDYLTGNKNKIMYTPTSPTLIENKNVVFIFDFVVREGGGTESGIIGGFSYNPEIIFSGKNNTDSKTVDFNEYTSISTTVELINARRTYGTGNPPPVFIDSAKSISISRFEDSIIPANQYEELYQASTVVLNYYKKNTGNVEDTINLTLDECPGRDVIGIYSVYNINSGSYLNVGIEKTLSNFKISGITASNGDILHYVVLLGNYTVDYVPHSKGIKNTAKIYTFSKSINVGETSGIIDVKQINPNCDSILTATGFYNGTEKRFVAYINNKMVRLNSLSVLPVGIDGLGSPVVKYTLESASLYTGQIDITFIGYYNPQDTDVFNFQYRYIPYKGLSSSILDVGETYNLKILKVDERVSIITAGTGTIEQKVPKKISSVTEMLPINKKIYDYNLFGESLPTILSGGSSAIRRLPGRFLTATEESTYLKEGQTIEIKLGEEDKEMLRGAIINSPYIYENGATFTPPAPIIPPTDTPLITDSRYEKRIDPTQVEYDPLYDPVSRYNHLNQWSALVKGLDGDLEGELFLMVITTVSSVYNSSEGSVYEYLEQKGIYFDDALGLGSETILNNTLSDNDLAQKLGNKIFGAVDLFPLKYRPLITEV